MLGASTSLFDALPGGPVFQRNSEGYAIALLVPLFWDLLTRLRPRLTPSPRAVADDTLLTRIAPFLVAVSIGVLATQPAVLDWVGLDLPGTFVTLGEAFVAALVIALYLLWSRQLGASHEPPSLGPIVDVARRIAYYVVIVAVLLLAYQQSVRSAVGDDPVDWLQRNDEAMGAVIVIPLYFDLVVRHSLSRALGWIGLMAAIPVAVQSGVLGSIDTNPVTGWLERITEAFVAAILIAVYFEWLRDAPE